MISGNWYSGFGNLVCGLKSSFNSGREVVYHSLWNITNQFGGDTIEPILELAGAKVVFYEISIAGVARLLDLERVCPRFDVRGDGRVCIFVESGIL